MKRNYTLLFFLLATVSILAQTPEKMSYQLVLRDATNTLLTNQQVGIQISILQTTITGSAVYIETQTATTNINGLVSLEIGTGASSDNFSAIDWSAGPFFIKTATDASGGSNYSIIGTSQLMSVPYALYAKTAGNDELKENTANKSTNVVTDAASDVKFPSVKSVKTYVDAVQDDVDANETASTTSDATLQGYIDALEARIAALEPQPIAAAIGDLRDGGVVFWVDPADNTHGLVCALQDYPNTLRWGCYGTDLPSVPNVDVALNNYNYIPVGLGAEIGDGESNTTGILADCSSAPAALAARSYGPEWFLPSINELKEMYVNKATLEAVSGFNVFSYLYWSSTERNNNDVWLQDFGGAQYYGWKNDDSSFNTISVRAVRAF
jgi:hypothetical protein